METTQATAFHPSAGAPEARNAEMSVKDWMITLFIMFIPLVNIIMLFVWAFGGDGNTPSRANWAKASLIWMLIGTVLYMIIALVFMGAMFSSGNF